METFTLYSIYLTGESAENALTICRRMGWCYDVYSDRAEINVPIEDLALFNFIFGELV